MRRPFLTVVRQVSLIMIKRAKNGGERGGERGGDIDKVRGGESEKRGRKSKRGLPFLISF